MQSQLQVTSVKLVDGFLSPADSYPNQYNSSKHLTTRKNTPKALLINGIIENEEVSFFSPTVVIRETSGFLNYKTCNTNSWIEIVDGKLESAHGAPMFDNGTLPNFALDSHSDIRIKVKEGDVLNITYNIKGEFRGKKTLTRVKLVK